MVHQGQRLTFGFEASHHLPGVHAQLDDFERDAAADRFLLLGHIDHATTAVTDFLEQSIPANSFAGFLR
jgi:hypothetical protein